MQVYHTQSSIYLPSADPWGWCDVQPTEDFCVVLYKRTYELTLFTGRKLIWTEEDHFRYQLKFGHEYRAITIFRGTNLEKNDGSIFVSGEGEVFLRAIESSKEISHVKRKVFFKYNVQNRGFWPFRWKREWFSALSEAKDWT